MSSSRLTLDASASTASQHSAFEQPAHEQQLAKLTKASYPVDKQEKFLKLQAEVETLFVQLQAFQRVRA